MNNKPIVFIDFDGTICHDRYWRTLPPEQYDKVQNLLFRNDTQKVNDWMRGKCSAEQINQLTASETGIPFPELWELFVNDCSSMKVSLEVLEKISALRRKYGVILMTGNMDSFTRFTVPALALDKYFDSISNSFYEGKLKTDEGGKLFLDYAEKYDVCIEDCIVIDDSEKVCSVFEVLGGSAFRITPQNDIHHHLSLLASA